MKPRKRPQFRIASLLWITLVVAAFLCGYRWHETGSGSSPKTIAPKGPVPVAFDFAFPVQDSQDDSEVFSFYMGINR